MRRGLILGLVLLLLTSACGRSQIAEQAEGAEADHQSGRTQPDGEVRSLLSVDVGQGEDGSGFSLGFDAEPAPESVVVAEATAPVVAAHSAPDQSEPIIGRFGQTTEVGGPQVFQLVDPDPQLDAAWFEVLLPVRPNGTTGWVRADDVSLFRNPFRIEIDTGGHSLVVFNENNEWLRTVIAIGTGDTPTPIGRFYITELLRPPTPGGPYGSFAFGLSGFSETLLNYAGGDGVIGIHGTNEPGSLGSNVSHGCVRMANDVIEELAGVLPLGTPVIIRR